MKAKITEIFRSIQGEGLYVGMPQVFVRFATCNMECAWCDTPAARIPNASEYKEMGREEVFNCISQLWDNCRSVSLTGGEPLLQEKFIKELLPFFQKAQVGSYLETNGILFKELQSVIDLVDVISMDVKLPSSTQCKGQWEAHKEFLKVASAKNVFVKAVVTNETTHEDTRKAGELIAEVDPKIPFILQPNTRDLTGDVVSKCLEYQKDCLRYLGDVRVIPQTHRFLNLR